MRELELYIHIPFCVRKCAYCDFLSAPASKEVRDRYVKTLIEEIRGGRPISAPLSVSCDKSLARTTASDSGSVFYSEQMGSCNTAADPGSVIYSEQVGSCNSQPGKALSLAQLPENTEYVITSVFFGGGTPSLLPPSQIAEILDALRVRFPFAGDNGRPGTPEITIECNPGTIGSGKQKSSQAFRTMEEHALTEVPTEMASSAKDKISGMEEEKPYAEHSSEGSQFRAYLASGINRISFGLQSAHNEELAALGRIHTWEMFLKSYQAARKAGVQNINVDLMSALPGQTVESWRQTLQQILTLAPEHISAYSLIIEEGTPFYEKYHEDDLRRSAGEEPRYLPSEEDERRMVQMTEQMLCSAGYVHYEISNYARPGFECRHNIGYWRGTEYMGFGLGASSLLRYPPQNRTRIKKNIRANEKFSAAVQEDATVYHTSEDKVQVGEGSSSPTHFISVRCKNPENFAVYEQKVHSQNMAAEVRTVDLGETENSNSPHTDLARSGNPEVLTVDAGKSENLQMLTAAAAKSENPEVLTMEDEMAEFMFLGLRMLSGVSEREFQTRFGRPIDDIYGDVICRMCSLGLMKREDDRIYLTPRGLDVSNQVMAEFLL